MQKQSNQNEPKKNDSLIKAVKLPKWCNKEEAVSVINFLIETGQVTIN